MTTGRYQKMNLHDRNYIVIDYKVSFDASISDFAPGNLDNSISFSVTNYIVIDFVVVPVPKFRNIDDDWQVSKIGGDVG